jgi:ribosome-binding protein aMBF1 (putative translation factor)
MPTTIQTVTLAGERFVIIPESEYRRLTTESGEPGLPPADSRGNYPAAQALQASIALEIVRRRRAAGLTQIELARRAAIRPETLNRIEQGKHAPSVSTIEKLDRELTKAEAKRR